MKLIYSHWNLYWKHLTQQHRLTSNNIQSSNQRYYRYTLDVTSNIQIHNFKKCALQESSAKLTNQRVSYAFTSSPFSFHASHILPASKFQYSYCCILLIFFRHQWTACMRTVSVKTVHWFDASSSVTPMNNPITLNHFITSTVAGLHVCSADSYMRSSANFRIVFSESQNASPFDAELGQNFNAKWPFKVIQGHPFRRQWRATNGLHGKIVALNVKVWKI